MKFTIVTTVLLGLLLTPALADNNSNTGNEKQDENKQMLTKQISVNGGFQTLSIHVQRRVAKIEEESNQGLWETIVNFNTGVVASKVLPERVCYVSKVNRLEMPDFNQIVSLIQEGMDLESQIQSAKSVTFAVERRVHDLSSYGRDIIDLCRGLPTYTAHLINRPQNQYNAQSCSIFNILQIWGLQYCQQFS